MENSTKIKNQIAKSSRLDFLFDIKEKGVELSNEDIQLLKDANYIEEKKIKGPKKQDESILTSDTTVKSERSIDADKKIDIIFGSETESISIASVEGHQKITEGTEFLFEGNSDIKKEDWIPVSKLEHEKDFVKWIDSINSGFKNKVHYKKFSLYVQQASEWFSENGSITDYHDISSQEDYGMEEMRRCAENTLYFLNKYLILKEGDVLSGARTYDAKPVHEVIAYLYDCGYSFMMGKPRQIAATSTLGGCALKSIVFNKNFFLKFITQDKETGVEIFDDKIKFPFGELPEWMKPDVSNDRDNLLRLSKKGKKKGTKKGVNSKLQIVAPSKSAINGGSPQVVMVDEAGYISILGAMMKEARPTMFMQDPDTKKLVMKRQIIVWGTGGEMDKGGKAYEEEFHTCLKKWGDREFESGIIPLFFDWTTRPGITKEFYDSEKLVYTVDGPDKDKKMVQFRQTYPAIIEDMFLTSSKLLVSIEYINKNIERIRNYPHEAKPQKGYFEPIFDTNSPAGENEDVPFKIIGATFVATEDDDPRASTIIFMHPKKNWRNRYYAGTDPISSDNGYSNMASAIIDVVFQTIPAIVNYRDSNHKYTFLQTMLLSMYYHAGNKPGRVKELVEANIGTAYIDYVETKGYYDSLVWKTELEGPMQGGGHTIGIDNRAARTRFIINRIFEFIQAYGDRVCIDTFFIQLRTFQCTVTASGQETWGTADKRKYHDDVLFAVVFAYICSLSYSHLIPKEIKGDSDRYRNVSELYRDSTGHLSRRTVRKRIS